MTTPTAPLTDAPTLRTERLILRGPEREDLAALTDWITTSPRMAIMGGNDTPVEAWLAFLTNVGRWHTDGFGYFTLTRHTDRDPLGRVGLLSYPADGTDRTVEVAWHLFDGAEGHGYVTEAATAIRDWARADLGLTHLVSFIDPANVRSQATATRLGATTDGTRPPHDPDCEVWTHPAPDRIAE